MLDFRTTLTRLTAAALILVIAVFIVFGFRRIAQGPQIVVNSFEITAPTRGIATLGGQSLETVGLSYNGKDIFTTKNGSFEETLTLFAGYNTYIITARDRFNRSETIVKEIWHNQPIRNYGNKKEDSIIESYREIKEGAASKSEDTSGN